MDINLIKHQPKMFVLTFLELSYKILSIRF